MTLENFESINHASQEETAKVYDEASTPSEKERTTVYESATSVRVAEKYGIGERGLGKPRLTSDEVVKGAKDSNPWSAITEELHD